MALSKAIAVVTALAKEGIIKSYAIAGAVAALNYIQPTLTEDLYILISIGDFEQRHSGLLLLTPIESALAVKGYSERTDVGIMIEGWPVQFLPVASELEEEALEKATDVIIEGKGDSASTARCLRPEHVVAIAVNLGRLKHLARIEAFLDQNAVPLPALAEVLTRHSLTDRWRGFCAKAGISDPLGLT
jgi:hypothetical protein